MAQASDPLKPVPLTEEQINRILSEIPTPPGVGKSAIATARKHLVNRVRATLETIELRPIPEAYEEFKETVIKNIYEAYVEPGMAVGVTSGVSLGGPVTQLSLNSFHFAGAQSGVALAFQKVRDFLTGSKMNRAPQMKIYFKVPFTGTDLHDTLHVGTFDSIMALRPEFEQTTVQDVVQDTGHILTRDEAEAAGVPAMMALHARLRPERFIDIANKFPLAYVVELQLNTYRMYTHRITMSMVAQAIEGPAPPDSLTCVWRSQLDGRMYILVDETKDYSQQRDYSQQAMNQTTAILMFLTRYVLRKFSVWKVSGITGILSIEPQSVEVSRAIYKVRKTPTVQYVYTNNKRTRWEGVSLADIQRLLRAAGFTVRELSPQSKKSLYVAVTGFDGNVRDELQARITAARDKNAADRTPQDNEIIAAASFHYGVTNGINMEEMVWRDDIDLLRTTSNYSHDIFSMFGIDAARVFLIFRFVQTLEDFSSYINIRHISLIFDLLCNLGIINSLSFVGINRRRIGPLAMASYERSMDVFVNSSVFGDKEAIVGVSPAIYVGQKSKRVGTGAISIEEDLTVIPRDRPTGGSIDEESYVGEDILIDEEVYEGSSLAVMLNNEEVRRNKIVPTTPGVPGVVNKGRITETARITNETQPVEVSLVPSGAQVILASQTLVTALQKVTTGTPIGVEPVKAYQREDDTDVIPDLADITDIAEIGDLSLMSPVAERYTPAAPAPVLDIMSSLQTVPTSGIEISVPIPLAPPVAPTVPETTIRQTEPMAVSPSSFINMLPNLSDVTIPTSTEGRVPGIALGSFMNRFSQYQQHLEGTMPTPPQ